MYNAVRLHEVNLYTESRSYMRKSLLWLQLFGDRAEEADGTVAMGDSSGAVNADDTLKMSESAEEASENGGSEENVSNDNAGDTVTDEEIRDISDVVDNTSETDPDSVSETKSKTADDLRDMERILSEADLLSEKVCGFDLQKEMRNKCFAAMIKSGVSVETAWKTVNFDRLLEAAVREAREEVWREALIKMKNAPVRPCENGAVSQAAIQSRVGVENLTGQGIREILRRVENGAKVKF